MAKIPTTRTSTASKTTYNALADGDYPARIVRFIGLGVQEQPMYQGEKKDPAFKCSIQFELIGVDAIGVDSEGKQIEPRPSCQFKDYYLFPNAKRGNVFDLCRMLDPSIDKVPADLDWFLNRLGEIVNVNVGHYKAKDGTIKNKVVSVNAIPSMFKNQIGPARSELVGFCPYTDTPEMMIAYSKLFKFQREMLVEAIDAEHIPFSGKEPLKQDAAAPSAPRTTSANQAPAGNDVPFDDDIPF